MGELSRVAVVSAWLAAVWAAAPLARVQSVGLAVAVPLVVVAVGALLVALERLGAGVVGIVLTTISVWGLAVVTWGPVCGTVLLVSGLVILTWGRREGRSHM